MSALEIIEQIKALPREEQEQVKAFARELPDADTMVMNTERAREISRRIFAENRELFTKLAQ